jgi:hypothetical protein
MGRFYWGPYAEQLGYDHEGSAARVLPDGTVTSSWTPGTADFVAHVAACACGWTGERRHPGDEVGEDAAAEEWERLHLAPLIVRLAQDGWRTWADRTAARAVEVTGHVHAGRLAVAAEVMGCLLADARTWADTLERLVEDSARPGGGR